MKYRVVKREFHAKKAVFWVQEKEPKDRKWKDVKCYYDDQAAQIEFQRLVTGNWQKKPYLESVMVESE